MWGCKRKEEWIRLHGRYLFQTSNMSKMHAPKIQLSCTWNFMGVIVAHESPCPETRQHKPPSTYWRCKSYYSLIWPTVQYPLWRVGVLPKVSSLSLIQGSGWRQLQRRQFSRKSRVRNWRRAQSCSHILEVGGNSLTNEIFHPQNPPFAVNECRKAFLFCMYCRIERSFFWQVAYWESHHEVPSTRERLHGINTWDCHQNVHKGFRIQCEADSHPAPRHRSRCNP